MIAAVIIFVTLVCGMSAYLMIRNYNQTHIGAQVQQMISSVPTIAYEDTGVIIYDMSNIEDVEFIEVQ